MRQVNVIFKYELEQIVKHKAALDDEIVLLVVERCYIETDTGFLLEYGCRAYQRSTWLSGGPGTTVTKFYESELRPCEAAKEGGV